MTTLSPTMATDSTIARPRAASQLLHWLALGGVLLLAAWLHFYRLDQEGYANQYYAAAVKSMLISPHNFFFVSFDPAGFVSVDKPPLGLWIQAVSAMVFGFSGWSILFPQALAGVLSVALVYWLARRVFGPLAGLIAALVLAITPISIAANRNNTMDSTLVFTLLLAAWAVSLAAERGQLRWLLLCALLVGIGFNIKMLQAFLVLPAFYAVYFLAPPIAWWKRILHLAAATIVLAVVSLSWTVVVDLTPPDQRPFVGSSHDNTVMELIVGHNGAARLFSFRRGGTPPTNNAPPSGQPPLNGQPGQFNPPPNGQPPLNGQPGQFNPPPNGQPPLNGQPGQFNPPPNGQIGQPPVGGQLPGGPGGQGAPRGGLANETGERGVFRLFNEQLSGQASWLLPLAALGMIAIAFSTPLRWPLRREHGALILWGLWLITQAVFFSVAGLFHRYYLEMMSPAIAVLVGAGVVAMWNWYKHGGLRSWVLPFAFLQTAAVEVFILAYFPEWAVWIAPVVIGLTLIAVAGLMVGKLVADSGAKLWLGFLAASGLIALLIAPAVWSLTPVLSQGDAGLPFAGPELLTRRGANTAPQSSPLVEYLLAHRSGEEFLLATLNANSAAPIILATGEPVMAMGGFSGGDQILTADQLAQKVEDGDVRFFLIPMDRQSDLTRWVTEQCAAVPSTEWASTPGGGFPGAGGPGGPGGPTQLYDCGT